MDEVWGLAAVGSMQPGPMPADTEAHLSRFADLAAAALVAGYRDEQNRQLLAEASRRWNLAADHERRRIERDLHDGAQQHLITLALYARAAEASAPTELAELKHQMSRIASGLADVSLELHEISRGIPPAILANGGLPAAITELARRSPVPVQLAVALPDRLPEPIETATYYLVAEALTNTAKHAHAGTVNLQVDTGDHAGDQCCGSRCATTAAAAPTPTVDPGWSGSQTGCKPSAAAFGYTARPAPAPPCAPNSHYARPLRHGGGLAAHAITLLDQR